MGLGVVRNWGLGHELGRKVIIGSKVDCIASKQ